MASDKEWESIEKFKKYYVGIAFGMASGFMLGLSQTASEQSLYILVSAIAGLLGFCTAPFYSSGKLIDKVKKAFVGTIIGFVIGLILSFSLLQNTISN